MRQEEGEGRWGGEGAVGGGSNRKDGEVLEEGKNGGKAGMEFRVGSVCKSFWLA